MISYRINAFIEGITSEFSVTRRKQSSCHSIIHLISMLYFVAGKLVSLRSFAS